MSIDGQNKVTATKASQDPRTYLKRGWFPVNSELLKNIKNKFKKGEYDANRDQLLEDLQSDLAVFTYLLSELSTVLEPQECAVNPAQVLRRIELDKLRSLLDVPEDAISPHRFDATARPQAQRIKHLLVATSATETLANKSKLDQEVLGIASVVRQLGLTLVAFNYPRIYANALNAVAKNGGELDAIITKVLGYSPLDLGSSLALGWNEFLPLKVVTSRKPEEELGVLLDDGLLGQNDAIMIREMIQMCEIGESLARLQGAEHCRQPTRSYDSIVADVKNFLGPDGMNLITERLNETQALYKVALPEQGRFDFSPERSVKLANTQFGKKLLGENSHVRKLPEEVQAEFQRVYELFEMNRISIAAINQLVGELMPKTGFARGCIYLTDTKKSQLVPMLRVGPVALSHFKSLNFPVIYGKIHPVVEALENANPIRQENECVNGEVVSYIAGTFESKERKGVLYLEMSEDLIKKTQMTSLYHFRAIRQCLADCLSLK